MKINLPYTKALADLRAIFVTHGHEIFFVGGAVRDIILGKTPKDIDLTTTANPEEQLAIYSEHNINHALTGLSHGTITVILSPSEVYEITSMRTESEHDGRHATVTYTNDISLDIFRRDLTINALVSDFDGNVIDYVGGISDLENNIVRFVGNAEERMREDYLRILRFFRFHARMNALLLDTETFHAIASCRQGLSSISVERIWMEISKIISGPNAVKTLKAMQTLVLFEITGLPPISYNNLEQAICSGINSPESLIGFSCEENDVISLAYDWKWSTAEKNRALFIAKNKSVNDIGAFKEMLVDKVDKEWVNDIVLFSGSNFIVSDWKVPVFPVKGNHLIDIGINTGPEMGVIISKLTKQWKSSNYVLSLKDLIKDIS